MSDVRPALVLIAHDKPAQLHRLIDAVDPWPVFLHIDANASDQMFTAMTDGLPERVTLLPRLKSGWAHYNVLAAELSGYEAALRQTDATHVLLGTGADYPLHSVGFIEDVLVQHPGRSFVEMQPLPHREWGPMRGYDRFIFVQKAWRRRRWWLPIPHPIPHYLRPAGGAQTKILTRRHAQLVLSAVARSPRLMAMYRTCWTPDEIVIPTFMNSPRYGMTLAADTVQDKHAWYTDWGDSPRPNPLWMTDADFDRLAAAATRPGVPALFARKFDDDSGPLCARIDAELRGRE